MPPGTIAETSPGTVFLLAAICTASKTFSTLDPSIPCRNNESVNHNQSLGFRICGGKQMENYKLLNSGTLSMVLSYKNFERIVVC